MNKNIDPKVLTTGRNRPNKKKNHQTKSKKEKVVLKPKDIIDYHRMDIIPSFLTEQNKIKPRRITHLTLKQQRQLSKAVKRARFLKVIPYVSTTED